MGLGERGADLRSSVTQAVLDARNGKWPSKGAANQPVSNQPAIGAQGSYQAVRSSRGLMTFVGGPDTVVNGLKAFHDQCGAGVVDLGFQATGISHKQVMEEIELFGREVLPRMKEF